MTPEITFGPSASETILGQFGVITDDEGYLMHEDSEQRVKSAYVEEEIPLEEWGGVIEGSTEFIKDDFAEVHTYIKEHEG